MAKTAKQIEKKLEALKDELNAVEAGLVKATKASDQAIMDGEKSPSLHGYRDRIEGLQRVIQKLETDDLAEAHDRVDRKRRKDALHYAKQKHMERMKKANEFDQALSTMWDAWKAYLKSNPELAEQAMAGGANVQSVLNKIGSTKVRDDTLIKAILAVAPEALHALGIVTNLKARHAQSLKTFEGRVGEVIIAAERDLDQTSPQIHKRNLALNDV